MLSVHAPRLSFWLVLSSKTHVFWLQSLICFPSYFSLQLLFCTPALSLIYSLILCLSRLCLIVQGCSQNSLRIPTIPPFYFSIQNAVFIILCRALCRQDSKHWIMSRRPQIAHNKISPIFIKPLSQLLIPQPLKRLSTQPHPSSTCSFLTPSFNCWMLQWYRSVWQQK